MTLEDIADHDASWRNAASLTGFDSIVPMSPTTFAKFLTGGTLNILNT